MKKVVVLFLPLLFTACVQSSLSLHYDPRHEGIPLQQFVKNDSLKTVSLGTYSRQTEDVSSLYEVNKNYTLLIVKLGNSKHVPRILSGLGSMSTPGRFSTITQSFYDFNIYDGATSISEIDSIELFGNHIVSGDKSPRMGDAIFFVSFKKLILRFNSDPSKIITMTVSSQKAEDQAELKFVEKNGTLYLLALSANDAHLPIKRGMLGYILHANEVSSK